MANNTVNVERGITGSGAGDDTYVISPALVEDGAVIKISDVEGANKIQIIGGLQIVSSQVAGDTAELTLSNGAVITVLGASTMDYEIGGNPLIGQAGVQKTYAQFGTDILGVAIPTDGSVAAGGASTVNDDGTASGGDPNAPSYILTAATAAADEGTTATFNLATTNVADGTVVNYTLTGVDAADVNGGLTGTTTVGADGTATISVELLADATTEGAETLTVTIDGQVANASVTVNDTSLTPAAPDFVLTTGDDTIVGTADQDVIDGFTNVNSLQDDDVILDSTTGDNDRLDVTVSTANVAARIQNIETINVNGQFINTGLDLTNVSGTETLTLSSGIVGGVATVTNANSLNVKAIAAGTNVNTLDVTSLSSGTRDSVAVDGAQAGTINITGNAGGADTYAVTAADDATVTLATVGANDAITLNAAGNDLNLTSASALEDLTINTTGDLDLAVTTALAADTVVNAAGDVVISGLNGALTAQGITKTGAGSVTLDITNNAAGSNYSTAVVDTVQLAAGLNGTVTVNENSVVNLDGAPAGNSTIELDNADGDLAAGAGTLLLNVSESTGAVTLTAGDNVGTVLLTATPDEATDTDADENGTAETQITINDLDMGNNAETVVVQGAEDLAITTWTNGTGNVLSASGLTGSLTIGAIASSATVVGGNGDDSITAGTAGQTYTIRAGQGNDTVDLNAANTSADVDGDAGNDTLIGGGAADSLDGGAGDDTITGGVGADTIATGAGSDTVIVDNGDNGDTITDFTAGTDTLVLTGAGSDVDLTDLTPATGAYDFDGTGNFTTTLQGSTATDLSGSVQLGTAEAAFDTTTAAGAADVVVVAGAKDDSLRAGDGANATTITTGAGSDTVAVVDLGVTVTDFTVGSDKVIVEAVSGGNVDLSSVTPAAGVYDIDGVGTFDFTLQNGGSALTATDLTAMVQLGSETTAFTAAAGGSAITGGTFNDYIAGGAGADTINFIDNGGMDTISSFTSTADDLSFDGITGITATAGSDLSGSTAQVSDPSDGTVYVFGNATAAHAGTATVDTFTVNAANGITADTILADVADFLDANLNVNAAGENYVAVMTDGTNSYAYLVAADADGVDADNITLIGTIVGEEVVAGDIA